MRPLGIGVGLLTLGVAGCGDTLTLDVQCEDVEVEATADERDDAVAVVEAALGGEALVAPATWADGAKTTLELDVAVVRPNFVRVESACDRGTRGWRAPGQLTASTTDDRLVQDGVASVWVGLEGQVRVTPDVLQIAPATRTALGVADGADVHEVAFRLDRGDLLVGWSVEQGDADVDRATIALTWSVE